MKFHSFILPVAALSAAIGCSRTISPAASETQTLEVVCPQATRISLDSLCRSVWNAGDAVSVFYKTPDNERWFYNGEDGATSGQLKYTGGRSKDTLDAIFAVYPYDNALKLSDGKISAAIPVSQSWAEGSFARDAALLGAKTTDDKLRFSYLTGFVRFTLGAPSDTTVFSVVLDTPDSVALAGAVEIDFASGIPVLSLKGSDKAVSVEPGEGFDGTAYFSVAPGTYPAGFRFTVNYVDGTRSIYAWSDTVKLAPGHIKPYKTAK